MIWIRTGSIDGAWKDYFDFGLGCVSCHPGRTDTVDEIVERVERALEVLAPEQITLNPLCGFAPGSAEKMDMDQVYQQMQKEVEAARRLRGE